MPSTTGRVCLWGVVAAALAAFTQVPAQAQIQEATLRVAAPGTNGFGRPDLGTASPSAYPNWPVYDTLTMINLQGDVVPLLATEWRSTSPTTWQFKLRRDVKFHNGAAFDADAIVAFVTYNLTGPGKGSTAGRAVGAQSKIAAVRALDPHTIEFTTSAPNPIVPRTMAGMWVPEPKAFAATTIEEFSRKPVGTGSFRVTDWKEQQVSYEAFPESWRAPRVRRMTMVNLPERPTRLQALLSNQIDIAVGMSIDNIDQIVGAGHKVDASPRPSVMGWRVFAQTKTSPFNDRRVRLAANMAVDRQTINQNLLRGLSRPGNQCAAHFSAGYNPNVPQYPYDPAGARKLLAEAGFASGFDMTVEVVPGNQTADTEIYQAVADQLTAVGIRTKLQPITFPDFLKKWLVRPDAPSLGFVGDAFQNFCNNNNVDALDDFSTLSCQRPPAPYCDQDELKLIEAAEKEFDAGKRTEILHQLLQKNHDGAPMIFMVEVIDIVGLSRRVQGFRNEIQRLSFHDVSLGN